MTKTNPTTGMTYTPEELKVLFEALNSAPSYLSRRFILKNMIGWSDDDLKANMTMLEEEAAMKRIGNKGGY